MCVTKIFVFLGPLPLELNLLGTKAIECRAYAKALHYKEEEFHKGPTIEVLETLISINNKLGQKEAASGLLEFARKNNRNDMKVIYLFIFYLKIFAWWLIIKNK